MYLPKSQISLLHNILDGFDLTTIIDDKTLAQIYSFLFASSVNTISFAAPDVQDTVLALKDIVEMEQMSTLEHLVSFFIEEDRAIDDIMNEIIKETEILVQNQVEEPEMPCPDYGIGLIEPQTAVRPALSRYVISSDKFKYDNFHREFEAMNKHLYKYFSSKLDSSFDIKELIHVTAIDAWDYYIQSKYDQSQINSIIWIKATNVLRDALDEQKKKQRIVPLSNARDHQYEYSLESKIDAAYILDHLLYRERFYDPVGWQILMTWAEGLTIKEIAEKNNMETGRVRRSLERWRKKLRKHFADFS